MLDKCDLETFSRWNVLKVLEETDIKTSSKMEITWHRGWPEVRSTCKRGFQVFDIVR